jgi:leucyl-tRNA synthetase
MAEEQKTTRVRYDRLREIEISMQQHWEQNPETYINVDAPADYQSMTTEQKNAGKYMATFPVPYMNGYLHVGHAFSMSKAEYQVRYQRQRGKHALFPFGFHCTGMPIQAAANRLKTEITTGKTRSVQPTEAPKTEEEPKKEEAKGKKGAKAVAVVRVPPT